MAHSQGTKAPQAKTSKLNLGKARTKRKPERAERKVSLSFIIFYKIYRSLSPLSSYHRRKAYFVSFPGDAREVRFCLYRWC
jgi:hypothetical protein